MNAKKLRGHHRIFKNIAAWKNSSLLLDLTDLERYQRECVKVWVRPFSDMSIAGKPVPKPKRKSRTLIIQSLLDIFNSWELQLKTLNKPYYLAIWLYEPNIEYSQVVCAMDDFLHFYDVTFYRPEVQKTMPTQNYGSLKKALDSFDWIYAKDDNYFTNEDVAMTEDSYYSMEEYSAQQKWYRRKLKQPLRSFTDQEGKITYYIPKDTVWIGTKN
tara:strand:+ start:909 stop:1550 length:642 start_codon:yes stop_codon:yes gene_type:complete